MFILQIKDLCMELIAYLTFTVIENE